MAVPSIHIHINPKQQIAHLIRLKAPFFLHHLSGSGSVNYYIVEVFPLVDFGETKWWMPQLALVCHFFLIHFAVIFLIISHIVLSERSGQSAAEALHGKP